MSDEDKDPPAWWRVIREVHQTSGVRHVLILTYTAIGGHVLLWCYFQVSVMLSLPHGG